MGLQVRLRHALGDRVLELSDRDVSQPWVIGRGNEADLKIPSVGIAPQHAALFVHEGQWVVQGYGGTVTLNGELLEMAAALRIGDVVGLGSESHPPTLEIDPVGAVAGRKGPARATPGASGATSHPGKPAMAASKATDMAQPAVSRFAAGPAAVPSGGSAGFGAGVHRPIRPSAPVDMDEPTLPSGDPADADTIEWDPQTPTPTTTEFYVPKGRQTPVGLIIAAAVVGVAALVGVAIVAYQRARQPAVVVIQPPANAPQRAAQAPKARMFDLDADQAAARQARSSESASGPPAGGQADATSGAGSSVDASPNNASPISSASNTSASPAPAPAPDPASPTPTAEPRTSAGTDDNAPDPDDPEWKEIEQAHFNVRHQGVAIVKYDEYRRAHPGKYTSWLDQYADDAVNWLYWQCVAQLSKQRDDLTAQVKQKKVDLQNQPAGAFHDQLAKDKADLEGRLAETTKQLTAEMGYTTDTAPDLEKPSELRQLAAKRDAAKYAAFRQHVLKYVRDHHGSVWWDAE